MRSVKTTRPQCRTGKKRLNWELKLSYHLLKLLEYIAWLPSVPPKL